MHDSLTAALPAARGLLARLDTGVSTAQNSTVNDRDAIREIALPLHRSAVVLERFAGQPSRRPTRLLTGVTPPADTTRLPP